MSKEDGTATVADAEPQVDASDAALEQAATAAWKGIEGEDSPVETPEPEAKPEAVVKDAPTEPQKADPVPAVEPAAPTPAWDKALQRVQQAVATLERANQAVAANPTPAAVVAATKAKSKLDSLLEASSEAIDPYDGVKTLAEEVHALKTAHAKERQEDATRFQTLQTQQAALDAASHRTRFAQDHPTLAPKYDEMMGTLRTRLTPYVEQAGGPIADALWNMLVDNEWKAMLAEVVPAKAPAPATKKVEQPTGTKVIKTKSGASAKSPGDEEAAYEAMSDKIFRQIHGLDE